MTWLNFFTTIYSLTIFILSVVIILDNRNPSRTLAWILVLIFLPGAGVFLYLYIGQNHRKKNTFIKKRKENYRILNHLLEEQVPITQYSGLFHQFFDDIRGKIIPLLLNNTYSPLTVNNEVKVLHNGEETFREMLQEIEGATHHIHMEYFIIKDSDIGRIFQKALIKKAEEGIEVRLIYDAVGSWKLKKDFLQPLKDAGVEAVAFLPVTIPFFGSRLNYRNHRKILIVDGQVGFVGGLNIGDEYLGKSEKMGFWRDVHLKIMGESVYVLQAIFLMDWYFVKKEEIDSLAYFPKQKDCGQRLIQVASSGPDSYWAAIQQTYFTALTGATKRAYIMSPYLIPDDSMLMALKTAALGGVDVRILLPGRPDHRTVFWASKSHFEELLEAGVQIYQYQKGFVHGKMILVDSVFTSIGTANIDIRSFQLNFEVNAFIYDEEVTDQLVEVFLEDLKDSKEVTLEEYHKRPLSHKAMESVTRLLSPIL
ncbi:phospholipase D/Transphosphatidylase [Alkaliphilus metalliredigens QYMF]|uniref:Cardiolipin synthase n=1 Tax=Alkaliphilus metalliredigens (strain QYMF) TaxID=293826 RepID=A6TX07_ALKMQ|nr:cardiolipin synthase [Alkaliphilus metalliredigens]ABR50725.1 phospholipase D/Transphosphatidylase [Alkaliphilus metalliredigens QYMF]